ncbi:MAG: N-acetylmuramoyl-L-alanine amidase [Pseudomonadota bacterium]|nr:N-acetylmuramoyl-L-alanine amidase [Pseudomonadota bacterium]
MSIGFLCKLFGLGIVLFAKSHIYFLIPASIIISILILISTLPLKAAEPIATNIRVGTHSDKTRFVIDLSDKIKFRIFALSDPYRIVIDLPEISWRLPVDVIKRNLGGKKTLISNFRYGYFRTGLSRIVLDIKEPIRVKSSFIITPRKGKKYRLVIDLVKTTRKIFLAAMRKSKLKERNKKSTLRRVENLRNNLLSRAPNPEKRTKLETSNSQGVQAKKKPVIVIDPGHGGIDPGSTSGRIFEKYITLEVAKVIESHLKTLGRYKVFLTRRKDKFIRLRKRISIAKLRGANLFISLHADAIKNKRVRGFSIYTLSEKASDKEAADLARKENKADVIAGVDLSAESPVVSDILIDLRQRNTMNESSKFAVGLVRHIRKVTKSLSNAHRFAGFAVLKSPDIPSVLIEMGFLSNRADEKALLNPRYRANLARSIGKAVDEYFLRY